MNKFDSNKKLKRKSNGKSNEKLSGGIFFALALSSISALALITVFIIVQGAPIIAKVGVLNFVFGMNWAPSQNEFGIFPMIIGSVSVTLGAAIIGVPIGICCSIFLTEFAPATLRNIFRPAIQLLAGIPSVVYGFWGLIFIVPFIRDYLGGPGLSILAGSIILGIMILPTVISISEVSILALPRQYKEGALALGMTHWQTIYSVLLPTAKSGIVAAVILGIGRAIGETMAVIMVLGNAVAIPTSILDPVRTLTTNIGIEMGYASGDHRQALFATGIVLFIIIMILNSAAQYIARKK
ncbi:MAG: phosphate ABC transporter permease subunit PstC [Oscillospiraceae bacterium]|nr:phosphate ABC transporter permease subunit PstC [Oscillospiraceae bacterium]